MKRTLAYQFWERRLVILVHSKDAPSDAEWKVYTDDMRKWCQQIRGILVLSEGGGPNGVQRGELEAALGNDTFEAGQREPADGRRFVGSRNQSIVHLTPRYADPALWRGPAGVELQLAADGEIGLHGAPALARRLGRALAGPG